MTFPVLDLDLLKAFVAVADQRSFTRAAAALNRTQSAVSMQIKRLEDRLGAELLSRSKVQVDLTAAGEGLLGYARRMLVLNEEAVGRLHAHRIEGRVRLGVMDDYGAVVVPPLLASFMGDYPRIHVEMETGLTGHMTERLGKAFDLVIAMHPKGRGDGVFLRRERPLWAASPAHLTETIDPLPVALYPKGCLFRQWAMDALDAAKRPWRLAFISHSSAAVEAIAAQGLAVTVLKSSTFPARLRALSQRNDSLRGRNDPLRGRDGPSRQRDSLPPLPEADIRLHQASGLSKPASLLADHLVAALRRRT